MTKRWYYYVRKLRELRNLLFAHTRTHTHTQQRFHNLMICCYCSYIQYSNIAARVLREALKTDLRADAAKRNESHVKFTPWANGKPARK